MQRIHLFHIDIPPKSSFGKGGLGGHEFNCHTLMNAKKGQPFGYPSFELLTRIELVTSSLPRKCSTTELQQQLAIKSGAKIRINFNFTNFL